MSWTVIFISAYVPIVLLVMLVLVNRLQGRAHSHAVQAGC